MKILVVGAGATGGYFGGRLAQAGRDVTFLVREQRAAALRERGLRIVGLGEQTLVEPAVVTAAELKQQYDLVLLTVKESGLAGAIDDMAPAVGPDTLIVPVLNGMRQIDLLVERFGERRVLGGIALVMTKLDADGDVVRLADIGELTFGARSGGPDPRVQAAAEALSGVGFKAQAIDDIVGAMWAKWAFIVSLGAINTLMDGTIGEVAAAPGGTRFAESVVAEAASVASAAGHALPERHLDGIRAMLTQTGSDSTSSLYRDLSAGLPVEAEQVLGDFTARAAAFGVPVPLLDLVTMRLRVHQLRLGAAVSRRSAPSR